MLLKFTRHCQERIIERNLDIGHIKTAIRIPDKKESKPEGRTLVRKFVDGKIIEVIYYREGFRDKREHYVVITAYYL